MTALQRAKAEDQHGTRDDGQGAGQGKHAPPSRDRHEQRRRGVDGQQGDLGRHGHRHDGACVAVTLQINGHQLDDGGPEQCLGKAVDTPQNDEKGDGGDKGKGGVAQRSGTQAEKDQLAGVDAVAQQTADDLSCAVGEKQRAADIADLHVGEQRVGNAQLDGTKALAGHIAGKVEKAKQNGNQRGRIVCLGFCGSHLFFIWVAQFCAAAHASSSSSSS